MSIMDKIRSGVKSWLRIQEAPNTTISIQEVMNFESNAIKNMIWYRGDSNELNQLYQQMSDNINMFWGAKSTKGMELHKLHTGVPGIMVDILSNLIMADLNNITTQDDDLDKLWNSIATDNSIDDLLEEAISNTLAIGDGAFKISYDTAISQYPIIEFVPGNEIDFIRKRGRISDIIFKTSYTANNKEYVLEEKYGYGYITYKLYHNGHETPLAVVPELANLQDTTWPDKSLMLAVPVRFFKSLKYKGRGKSIYDGKIDNFDALDEAWSQWMDALRKNRTNRYIPSSLIPRDPNTGALLKPNAFDNSFIEIESSMSEGAHNKIETSTGTIPHDSYLSTYVTALDLCLQGIISPSTMGIDTKKLDNAEAQREKEKTTLYTRNKIVDKLQKIIPQLVITTLKCVDTYNKRTSQEYKVTVEFGEYANPSFESQVETIGKAKQQGIMSIDAAVEELYGDTKDDEWKKEEVIRIKSEQGIEVVDIQDPEEMLLEDGDLIE